MHLPNGKCQLKFVSLLGSSSLALFKVIFIFLVFLSQKTIDYILNVTGEIKLIISIKIFDVLIANLIYKFVILHIQFSKNIEYYFRNIQVETKGFEPTTPCLQGRCSPNWATPPKIWQSLIFPYRYQHSIFSRLRLNRRVRDGNGCFP